MTGKSVVGFLADVLYLKGFICYDEFEDIMNAQNDVDLGNIVEKMLRSEYNVYKKGESYGTLIK
jgi:hypothetical protein